MEDLIPIVGIAATIFALIVITIDQLTIRERGPEVLKRIGTRICGEYRNALITYEFLVLIFIIFYVLPALWGDPAQATSFFVYVFMMTILSPFVVYVMIWHRFNPNDWEKHGSDYVFDTMIEEQFQTSENFDEFLMHLFQEYYDNPSSRMGQEFAKVMGRFMARDDDIGRAFRRAFDRWKTTR